MKDDTKNDPTYQKRALIYSKVWTLSWVTNSFGSFRKGVGGGLVSVSFGKTTQGPKVGTKPGAEPPRLGD